MMSYEVTPTNHLILPPITSITGDFPTIELTLPNASPQLGVKKIDEMTYKEANTDTENIENDNEIEMEVKEKRKRAVPFSEEENDLIMHYVLHYFGSNANRVPWSFWHIFRKMTGNNRSISSLYHHWICKLCKRYHHFYKSKKNQILNQKNGKSNNEDFKNIAYPNLNSHNDLQKQKSFSPVNQVNISLFGDSNINRLNPVGMQAYQPYYATVVHDSSNLQGYPLTRVMSYGEQPIYNNTF